MSAGGFRLGSLHISWRDYGAAVVATVSDFTSAEVLGEATDQDLARAIGQAILNTKERARSQTGEDNPAGRK